MHCNTLPSFFLLAMLPAALATPHLHLQKRALTFRTYDSMSISVSAAGNASAEATAIWDIGVDTANLAGVTAADLNILSVERENAENAEGQAFDPAIDAAGGASVATALQCGKIKNKVLKLTGLSLINQIKLAQAGAGTDTSTIQAALDDTNSKLQTNIQLDQAAAGTQCQAVDFVGQSV